MKSMKWFPKPSSFSQEESSQLYASTVLAAARLLSQLRRSTAPTASFLERECGRAQELGQALSLLQIEIADWRSVVTSLGEERVEKTHEELELVLRGTLRATDILRTEQVGSFLVVLPGTQASDLPTVIQNLRLAVRSYRILAPDGAPFFLRLYPWVASASLPEDGLGASELLVVLEQRLQQERQQPLPPTQDEDDTSGKPSLRLVA
jgi:GGDEF domain-containing protein